MVEEAAAPACPLWLLLHCPLVLGLPGGRLLPAPAPHVSGRVEGQLETGRSENSADAVNGDGPTSM